MKTKCGVILTGGDFQGLAALRALARNGVPVLLLDHDHCISRYSRYGHRFLRAPSPGDPDRYVQFLIDLADRENVRDWLIIPNSDEIVYALSTNRERLQQYYRLGTPSWDVIKYVHIKQQTYQLAQELNINIPRSYFPASVAELAQLDIEFPAIIKPSIRDHLYQQVHTKAFRVNNRDELVKTYNHVSQLIAPSEIIIQDLIPGGADVLYSFCPFFKNGSVIASITAKRSRQHPMTFGHASTFAELTTIPALQDAATVFLKAINYYGLCEVEFMYDRRDNTYRFLEINPRIWGWHGLAIAAGVNFPALLYADALGHQLSMQQPADTMKWIRLATDIPTVLGEIIKGNMQLRDYFASMKGRKTFAVFDKADPAPFLAELIMLPYLALKRGF